MLKNKAVRGFTLIELVIVIAVIAILAALLVPTIMNQTERARISRAQGDVNEIGKAMARMRSNTSSTTVACYASANLTAATAPANCAPASGGTLAACVGAAPDAFCWGGPYLPVVPTLDPWSKTYIVTYDSTTTSITVTSTGNDGATGGTGSAADIIKTF
jgi:general secretion pathway protein G